MSFLYYCFLGVLIVSQLEMVSSISDDEPTLLLVSRQFKTDFGEVLALGDKGSELPAPLFQIQQHDFDWDLSYGINLTWIYYYQSLVSFLSWMENRQNFSDPVIRSPHYYGVQITVTLNATKNDPKAEQERIATFLYLIMNKCYHEKSYTAFNGTLFWKGMEYAKLDIRAENPEPSLQQPQPEALSRRYRPSSKSRLFNPHMSVETKTSNISLGVNPSNTERALWEAASYLVYAFRGEASEIFIKSNTPLCLKLIALTHDRLIVPQQALDGFIDLAEWAGSLHEAMRATTTILLNHTPFARIDLLYSSGGLWECK